jgi:GT2 family glycosyltransferase
MKSGYKEQINWYPQVCIIILNFNSSEETLSLIDCINMIDYPDYKIIIIDNHSDEIDRKNLNIKLSGKNINIYFNDINSGYAGGNNIGLRYAIENKFDLAWILNPDVRPDKNSLLTLVKSFLSEKLIGALGPRILYRDKPNIIFSDGGKIDFEKGYYTFHVNHGINFKELNSNFKKYEEVDYLHGNSILLNLKAVKDIGYLYEGFFLYYEETEWCQRAWGQGWKIKNNREACIYQGETRNPSLMNYYLFRNRIWLSKITQKVRIKTIFFTGMDILKFLYWSMIKRTNKYFYLSMISGYIHGIIRKPR